MGDKIQVSVGIDSTKFQSGLASMRKWSSDFAGDLRSQLTGAIAGFALLTGAVKVAHAAFGLLKSAVQKASEMQQLETSFKVLLGNAEAAKQMMKDLNAVAAKTPFSTMDLASAASTLLSFGVSASTVIDTMLRLGDASGGNLEKFKGLVEIYGKAKTAGRLMGDDMLQLAGRGIPIYDELAKRFGVTTAEVSKLVEQGKVGFKDLEAVIVSLTSKGGLFFGMMDEQSKTLAGKISSLGDAWNMMLVAFANPSLEVLGKNVDSVSASFSNATEWANRFGKVFAASMGIVTVALEGTMGIFKVFFNEIRTLAAEATEIFMTLGLTIEETLKGNFSAATDAVKASSDRITKIIQDGAEKRRKIMEEAGFGVAAAGQMITQPFKDQASGKAAPEKQKASASEAPAGPSKEQLKIQERMERLQKNEEDAMRDRLEGEAKINAMMEERNRLMQQALTAPDDEKRLDALEAEQKLRREIEREVEKQKEEAKRKADDQRKQDEADILAIAQAREEEAKARREEQLEQMTPQQRIAKFQQEKNRLEEDAKNMEETDPAAAAKKRTEAIGLGKQIRDEQGKLDEESKRKAEELKSKLDEDAKKREEGKRRAAEVPVSSLQAVGGGGRAGPSSAADPVLRENQKQTQQQQEMVMLLRQLAGATTAPQAAPPSV